MRKKVNFRKESETNNITDLWIQLLVQRIIVEQLDIPHRLKAKLIYETSNKNGNGEK